MPPQGPFKTICIISLPRRAQLSAVIPPLLQWLEAHGIRALLDKETGSSVDQPANARTRQELASESDLLLVLGGDGTLLAAARVAAPHGIPLLPINMGSLGFLTSFTLEEMFPALEETLAGRSSVSERVLLRVDLHRGGQLIYGQRR